MDQWIGTPNARNGLIELRNQRDAAVQKELSMKVCACCTLDRDGREEESKQREERGNRESRVQNAALGGVHAVV